ncbi:TonB-dependent copper receptor [Arhodomonas aquaeolei]|uniref:TonB-dependent copper receptor n=1 Tax=Arhodomonas aquaeolei TaxID=2369 RepID=UPI000374523A|nr:TonB-dependent copper receptor [Arhodomonas aquaeolei]
MPVTRIARRRAPVAGGFFAAAVAACPAVAAEPGDTSITVEDVVVTAPMMGDPFTVVTDPRRPRQPVPAPDGGAYLKPIPGFSLSRKGGTNGDPALRGLGGSRLNIGVNDSAIPGGCPHRMDPPTAYVVPEAFDRITVLKGPQSVRYGASVAGTVRFERDTGRFEAPGTRAVFSALGGSFERNDQLVDITAGNRSGYLRGIATRSEAGDYEDGDGETVHSAFERWSTTAIAGWTPDADTRVELTYERGDGEAAYADRSMDGAAFDRTGVSLRATRENISPLIARVEATLYRNEIDHVMDNYTLRDTAPSVYRVMNPRRVTRGGRIEATLDLSAATALVTGVDYQHSARDGRMAMSATGEPALGDREDVATFRQTGVFGELAHYLGARDRVVVGARADEVTVTADRQVTMMDPDGYGGVAAGTDDSDTNLSGFTRWEHELAASPASVYLGLGHAQRSPDFWERDRDFPLDPERATQLDAGWQYRGSRLTTTVALFYSRIDDYILITDDGDDARNIRARTVGGELDLRYALTTRWALTGTVSYVRGENRTDGVPLAQMPPLEGTLGLRYDDGPWSGGVLLRGVARQDRIDPGSGTIYGTDIGETGGFGVVSVNAGYRPGERWTVTAGVDNLFDRTYAEHLASGSADAGTRTGRVNEPGRNAWVKLTARF